MPNLIISERSKEIAKIPGADISALGEGPDGRIVAVAGDSLHIIDAHNHKVVDADADSSRCLDFSEESGLVVFGSRWGNIYVEKQSGGFIVNRVHTGTVIAMSNLGKDGFLTCGVDRTLKRWHPEHIFDAETLAELPEEDPICCMCVDRPRMVAFVGMNSGRIYRVDLKSKNIRVLVQASLPITAIAYDYHLDRLLFADVEGKLGERPSL